MKITKQRLKEIVREEINNLSESKRWKVYIDGEREPFIIGGKNIKDAKRAAHAMTYPAKIKIKKIVKEGKLTESWDTAKQAWSSKEAKNIMDNSLKNYAKQLRKVEHSVIKDWMTKAKSGVLDFFDIEKGLTTGDITRAHPEETEFLHKILTKDKILDRFRSYFGGKKGKRRN